MARGFIPVDRSPVLLPADMMEWLPRDDLVFLVMDTVASFDLSQMYAQFRLGGVGRQAYDPQMLTTLLVYAYCQGERSSRRIERLCVTDVAYRVICGNLCPDHSTIARFRSRCGAVLAGLFTQMLRMCAQAGMCKVGVVAVDGTKIAGRGSLEADHSMQYLHDLADHILAEADQVDREEDRIHGSLRGDELPEGLAPGPDRVERLRKLAESSVKAKQVVEALDEAERVTAERVKHDVRVASSLLDKARAHRDKMIDKASKDRRDDDDPRGLRAPRKPLDEHASIRKVDARITQLEQKLGDAQQGLGLMASRKRAGVNLVDPQSRPMPIKNGRAWLQGYNSQIVVSDDHLILATDVVQSSTDQALFVPMMTQAVDIVTAVLPGESIGVILADAGYCSEEALTTPGPDRLIAVGRDPGLLRRGSKQEAMAQMGQRLQSGSPDRDTYKRRAATVETVFANLKSTLNMRQFSRKGLQAAREEWAFIAAVFNLRRLAVHRGFSLR